MAVRDDEVAARTEQARAIGLFRYQLIREPADPRLSSRARGRLVREIAARVHLDPAGRRRRISRDTLDRWIRAWRRGGFDALVPDPRQGPRRPAPPAQLSESSWPLRRLLWRRPQLTPFRRHQSNNLTPLGDNSQSQQRLAPISLQFTRAPLMQTIIVDQPGVEVRRVELQKQGPQRQRVEVELRGFEPLTP